MNKHLTGDFASKLNTTKQWTSVEVSLCDLDIHYDRILELASESEGYYTELADDRYACVRFQLPEDAYSFKEMYLGVS